MGNCSSSGEVERNFAEKQRQRGAVPANGQAVCAAAAPPAQQMYSAAAPQPAAAPYANPAPTQQTYGQPPGTYDPNTGQPLSNGPVAHGAMPPGYAAPGAMGPDGNGNPTITNEHTVNGIHGSGSIARKAGEVLILSYDLGTTAC